MDAIQDMADYYNQLYHDTSEVTAITVLNGARPFSKALLPLLKPAVVEDEMKVSSMSGTESTGTLTFETEPSVDVAHKHILVLEDLVDTGLTISGLYKYFVHERGAESVHFAALFEKPESRDPKTEIPNLTTGIRIAQKYILGFGMDWDEDYRDLPFVTYIEKDSSGKLAMVYSEAA